MTARPMSSRPSVLVVAFARHAYTIDRLREELAAAGAVSSVASPADLVPVLDGGSVRERALPRPDGAIHAWWGARGPSRHVLTAWEAGGTVVLNRVAPTLLAADKFAASAALAAAGLPQLASAVTTDRAADLAAAERLGYPLVVKPLAGSGGHHTSLARDSAELERAAALARPHDGFELLVQAFAPDAAGVDRRAFIAGGRVVAAMDRTARPGDFRSNVAQGGTTTAVTLTAAEADLAIAAVGVLGLDYGGVDLVRAAAGRTADGGTEPVVLEVNAEAQFEALERATGVNVAGALARLLVGRL